MQLVKIITHENSSPSVYSWKNVQEALFVQVMDSSFMLVTREVFRFICFFFRDRSTETALNPFSYIQKIKNCCKLKRTREGERF